MSKATDYFFKNPYCILGLSCNAEDIDIIKAQEKIEKLAKLGVAESYKTQYSDPDFPAIDRSSGVVQTALADISNPVHKLFWFSTADILKNPETAKNMFMQTDPEQINYEVFLFNYIELLSNKFSINQKEQWTKIFKYISFLLTYTDTCSDADLSLVLSFRNISADAISKNILNPIIDYCAQEDIGTEINIADIINKVESECEIASELNKAKYDISELVIEKLTLEIVGLTEFASEIDMNDEIKPKDTNMAASATSKIEKMCLQYIDPIVETFDDVTIDRINDVVYSNLNICANVFLAGNSFKNAFSALNLALKYAPENETASIREVVNNLREMKDFEEKIVVARRNHGLTSNDEILLKHRDFSVRMLVMKAVSGDAESQYFLGALYDSKGNSLNVPYDEGSSKFWLEKSSSKGNRDAKTRLGIKYLNDGITFSDHDRRKQGIDLLEQASYLGDQQAAALLSKYRSSRNAAVASGVASGLGCLIPMTLTLLITTIIICCIFAIV